MNWKSTAELGCRVWILLVLAIFGVASAKADQIGLTIESSVLASASNVSQTFNANAPNGVLTVSPSLSVSNDGAAASLSGSVQFGDIVSSLSASGGAAGSGQGAESQFVGVWQDTVTATSSTLAAGTPAVLQFTMSYDFTTICGGANAIGQVVADLDVPDTVLSVANDNSCNETLAGTPTYDLNTAVGTTTAIEGFVNLLADSGEASSVTVDPPIAFYIDSLTANVGYITGSGTDYSTPVTTTPEPSSLLMLGSGLLGLLALAARSKRQAPPTSC